MSKIDGEMLLGFGDFFEPGRTIGAAALVRSTPAAKPAAAPRTLARKPTDKAPKTKGALAAAVKKYPTKNVPKGTSAMEKHGKVLKAAHNTATKAVNTVMKAVKVLGNAKTMAVRAKPITAHIGAAVVAAAAKGKLTPKATAAVQKHDLAVQKANQANKVLAQHAVKTKQAVAELAKKMTAQKKIAVAMRAPAGKKTVVGQMMTDPEIGCDVAQAVQDVIGQIVQGGVPPDPANPGYLMDGNPDPAYGAGGGYDPSLDPSLGMPSLGDPTLDPLGVDAGTDLPPVPDIGYQEPDCHAVGGIVYTGQKGYPDGYAGSLGLMTRTTDDSANVPQTAGIDPIDHFGYVWGKFWDKDGHGGIPFGNDLQSGTWNHVRGRHALAGDWWNTVGPAEAIASNAKNSPQGRPYGPLVGNPNMPDFAQMRIDYGGNAFWYPQQAPDWVTFPLKQAAALTAQAAQAAAAAAAQANAAAMQAMQQQAAVAQAQQDAANALAESQAQSQANQAQLQAQGDQAATETQAQQQLIQQAQQQQAQAAQDAAQQLAEQQQAAPLLSQQAQINLQQQQQSLAAQQQMLDYAQAHPEEVYGPDAGGDDGGGDQGGGDDGGGDDGGGDDGGDYGTMSDDDILSQAAQIGGEDHFALPFPGQGANDFETAGVAGQFDDGLGIPGADLMGDFDGEGFSE